MQELSMNVLDIAENSVRAGASLIEIGLCIETEPKQMTLVIQDNGKGMDSDTVRNVTDPFFTSRTTRKVGLGLPFLKMAAELAEGTLCLDSVVGKGTCVTATFRLGHIDLAPLGDMSSTVVSLVQCNPDLEFLYTVTADGECFAMDTREIKQILDGVSLAEPEVALWLRQYLDENTQHLLKKELSL